MHHLDRDNTRTLTTSFTFWQQQSRWLVDLLHLLPRYDIY